MSPAKRAPAGKRPVRVLATGTFDILHPGHLRYLKDARKLGDELWVIVARTANVRHKPKPVMPERHRLQMIASLRVVDRAILGSRRDIFEFLPTIHPDIVALGADQHFDAQWLQRQLDKRGIRARVVRVQDYDPDPFCSSGRIIERIGRRMPRTRGR
ncbi:MAG: FAD synthase [Euryarchaeota archaeon]|nr:FAD synthase [Euryarchaeota archaeon]